MTRRRSLVAPPRHSPLHPPSPHPNPPAAACACANALVPARTIRCPLITAPQCHRSAPACASAFPSQPMCRSSHFVRCVLLSLPFAFAFALAFASDLSGGWLQPLRRNGLQSWCVALACAVLCPALCPAAVSCAVLCCGALCCAVCRVVPRSARVRAVGAGSHLLRRPHTVPSFSGKTQASVAFDQSSNRCGTWHFSVVGNGTAGRFLQRWSGSDAGGVSGGRGGTNAAMATSATLTPQVRVGVRTCGVEYMWGAGQTAALAEASDALRC